MQTDDFEWDNAKAARNFEKHRISFEEATFAFDDRHGIDIIDDSERYAEVRFKLIASDGQKLLAVIYTERVPRLRIISAREADAHEQVRYNERRGLG